MTDPEGIPVAFLLNDSPSPDFSSFPHDTLLPQNLLLPQQSLTSRDSHALSYLDCSSIHRIEEGSEKISLLVYQRTCPYTRNGSIHPQIRLKSNVTLPSSFGVGCRNPNRLLKSNWSFFCVSVSHSRTNSAIKVTEIKQFSGAMLLLGKNSFQETHYEILSVKEDASYEEIRASYKSAHPDKLQASDHPIGMQEQFMNVLRAWEILSDSNTRSLYDNELKASRHDLETAEDISLKDMTMEDVSEVMELFYQCRCGDFFAVDSAELEEMGYSIYRQGNKVHTCTLLHGVTT